MEVLKAEIKKRRKLYRLLQLMRFLYQSKWFESGREKKTYPKILQFPITSKCNSKCVMCNVYKFDSRNEMKIDQFRKIINDDLFKDIESVGINGGEPFLFAELNLFISELLKKPNIKSINIISNGFLTGIILNKIKEIYAICKEREVHFHVSFSLDGYGKIHDAVRGIDGAFDKTMKTVREIADNTNVYCDTWDLACTVVNHNVDYLVELDTFLKMNNFPIKYRLGIENERLDNTDKKDSFSVLNCMSSKQSAKEFFYSKVFEEQDFYAKYKYYAIFRYLSVAPVRKLGCDWKTNGVTLDPKGNIYYCAVKSPCIGNLHEQSGEKVYFSQESIEKKADIMNKYCESCIHDYYGQLKLNDVIEFIGFLWNGRRWINQYK